MEIKTQHNYVYEPRGCDNITAGRRVAEAKNGQGDAGKKMEEEDAKETMEDASSNVVMVAIKIGRAARM